MILGNPLMWESYFIIKFGFAFLLIALMLFLLAVGAVFALFQAAWEDYKGRRDENEPRAGKTLGL